MVLAARPDAVAVWHFGGRTPGRINRALSNLDFGVPRTSRKFFDRVPVAIARGKVHRGKVAGGAQHGIDRAHALEKIRPVNRRQQAHARDHVADGNVHRALPLMHLTDDLVCRGSLRRQPLVQPPQRRRHLGILIAQALNHLHREGRRQRRLIQILEHCLGRLRVAAVRSQQPVRQQVGMAAFRTAVAHLFSQAPQVFDQHDPKRNRDRP